MFARPVTIAEWLGTVFALLYVLLVSRQIIWCWVSNFLSSVLAGIVFYHTGFYLLAILQIYYCGVAIYGWTSWARKGPDEDAKTINRLTAKQLLLALGGAATLICTSLLAAYLLGKSLAWTLIGEYCAVWMSVLAMLLAAKKYIDSWVLWACINSLYIALFAQAGLYGYAGLNTVFLVLSFYGFWQWRKNLQSALA